MTVDIVGMGNHQIKYPTENKFDSLAEYLTIAKKTIKAFADGLRPGLAEEMLKSEDAISNVSTAIMLADWRWTPEYKSEDGQVRTRYSYRNQCALWAIHGYINRRSHTTYLVSLNANISANRDTTLHEIIESDIPAPDAEMIEQEQKDKIEAMLKASCLTGLQEKYIKLYYLDNLTYQEIANESGCTREAVRQIIERGLTNIRKLGVSQWESKKT